MFITKHWMSLLLFFSLVWWKAHNAHTLCNKKCFLHIFFCARRQVCQWRMKIREEDNHGNHHNEISELLILHSTVRCIATFYREHNEPQQYLTVFAVHFASSWKCENFSNIYSTAWNAVRRSIFNSLCILYGCHCCNVYSRFVLNSSNLSVTKFFCLLLTPMLTSIFFFFFFCCHISQQIQKRSKCAHIWRHMYVWKMHNLNISLQIVICSTNQAQIQNGDVEGIKLDDNTFLHVYILYYVILIY